MRRGEIWEAEQKPRSGSEQSGRRPVLVISSDGFNAINGWRSVIVIPCSTFRHFPEARFAGVCGP